MSLPNVVTYSLPAGTSTSLAATQAATSLAIGLATTLVPGTNQRRITVVSAADDGGVAFRIVGLNQAGFTTVENLAGGNATTTAQSNLDFRTVISVTPQNITSGALATTAGTVSVGVNGVGSAPWNIMNWHVTPCNVSLSVAAPSPAAGTYTCEYTYDDPNNLPSGVAFANPINVGTFGANGTTLSQDALLTTVLTGTRLKVLAGTGSFRYTAIQAGLEG